MKPAVEWSWANTDLVYDADHNTYYLQEYRPDGSGDTRESTMYATIASAIDDYWKKTAAWGDWH